MICFDWTLDKKKNDLRKIYIRKIKKSSRKIEWKETRVAFARPVEEKKQRTFVARMGKYSEIIQQLVGAAYQGNRSYFVSNVLDTRTASMIRNIL